MSALVQGVTSTVTSDGTGLVVAGLGVLATLALAFREWINRRDSPSAGWRAALDEVKSTQSEQASEIATLRSEVRRLTNEGAAKDAVIVQQQKALDAKDGRIVQLLTAWPEGSRPPSPSPAHEPYL